MGSPVVLPVAAQISTSNLRAADPAEVRKRIGLVPQLSPMPCSPTLQRADETE